MEEKSSDSFPYLILESYSLDDGAYVFCCMDNNLRLLEFNENSYYKYDDVIFVSFVRNQSNRIREGKLYKDLLYFLSKLNPNYIGSTYSFFENSVNSIMIYSDSTFCNVPKGESLNHFFTIEGQFVRVVNEKYELYNGSDILDKDKRIDRIFFPEEFRLKLIKGLDIERNTYRFYLRLTYGSNVANMKIAEINFSN